MSSFGKCALHFTELLTDKSYLPSLLFHNVSAECSFQFSTYQLDFNEPFFINDFHFESLIFITSFNGTLKHELMLINYVDGDRQSVKRAHLI